MAPLFRFKTIQQDQLDMKALQNSIDNDPVELLKECRRYQGDWKIGTRRLNWQHWVACYAGAQGIRQQPELFDRLLADDYFARRTYKADITDILRLAFLIGTDADVKGTTYKSACHIALHLQPLFDAEVKPEEVLKRIETAGGLKRLNVPEVATGTSKADAEGLTDDAEDVGLGDDDNDEWDDWSAQPSDDHEDSNKEPTASLTNARSPARSRPSGHRTMPSGSTKARAGQFRVKQPTSQSKQVMKSSQNFAQEPGDDMIILEVEVTPEMLSRVLNSDLSVLCVKRLDLNESWYPVVCSRLDSLD